MKFGKNIENFSNEPVVKIRFIAITKEWRDKVNGNTYFSTQIEDIENNKIYILPFQYGYGSHSEYEAKRVLDISNTKKIPWFSIRFIKIERCLKKEVVEHGKGNEHNFIQPLNDLGFYYQGYED